MSEAVVKEIDGKLVLFDSDALALVTVVNKRNCINTFTLNLDRVRYYRKRMVESKKSPQDWVIVVLSVDDENGAAMADVLMPNCNWQEIRDRGETPFAIGIADRSFVQETVELFDKKAAAKLKKRNMSAVVVDLEVAEIYKV